MAIIERFSEAAVLAKLCSVTLLVAMLLVWIAFTCTGWGGYDRKTEPYERSGKHFGLWRVCSDSKYMSSCDPLDGVTIEWFGIVQACAIFGFFGINLAFFLLVLYIFVPSCQRNKEVGMAASIICIVTAGLYLVGVIIFGVRYKRDYINELEDDYRFGYCYFLSIVAILLEGGSGVLLFFETRLNGATPTDRQHLTSSGYQANPTYGASTTREQTA
ncbi:uncharacterized protein LOC123543709 [Mercenaria mercenaria]|uniref:uncharacterized protein LOC123543709 n=1 Tax=Mercenaria mercenaria TaxID=6596 RepID=UPI001E1E1D9D|nr:uncharacterized protein LOC123543709 [Mercenaria mercenaria]